MNSPEHVSTFAPALLNQARDEFRHSGRDPLALLESVSGLSPREIYGDLSNQFGWPTLETVDMLALQPAFDLLPLAKCLSRSALLLRNGDNQIVAVISNPFDADLLVWLESHAKKSGQTCLALASDIQAYLDKQEVGAKAIDTILDQQGINGAEEIYSTVLSFSSVNDSASPAVKLVNSTLYDALKATASDVHFESTNSGMAIKYRVDGVLISVAAIHGNELAEQTISRLKVLSELDIAERRTPQDGSFRVQSGGRGIDLRVSIMPSIHGEDAVIRILDKRAMIEAYGSLTLQALGFDAYSLAALRELAEAAHGMLLVTGPTGSGKTTTLYAAISETNNGRDKIITIEDPVEYQLPGVLQIPVNDKKGLTFARGLRSILRHDPDKIMVGEIRDAETAEIAVQSALTGHLVLTTVHANNVFDVFGRFTHMGIDPYAFVSALNGIWAQRLLRLNCPHCTRPVTPATEDILRVGLSPEAVTDFRFMAGAGCGDCRGSGYKGRKAIAEILLLNDEIRELIIEKAPLRKIKETARKYGTRTMRDTSLDLVKHGETTLEEVRRVTLEE